MDALILSCGTGGGHNSAGRALEQELRARGHSVAFLDPYTLRGPRTSGAVNRGYISLAQRAPRAFGALYGLGDAVRRLPGRSPVYYVNRPMASVLERYLDGHPCDVIFMPHLFPAEMVTNLKARGRHVPDTFFIATDYTCIPFTEETDCDIYIIPASTLTGEFAGRGIPRERLRPLGIPVRREFVSGGDMASARAALGLEQDRLHILVAGGSIGAGHLEDSVAALTERFPEARLTVICGNNRALYDRLRRDYGPNCGAIGYTSRMADYMRSCDIFISKPGGLSSSEAAAVGAALVHVTPIPGCETKNMEFFASRGMCVPVTDPKNELAAACESLFDPAARAAMRAAQRSALPRLPAAKIVDLAEKRFGERNK